MVIVVHAKYGSLSWLDGALHRRADQAKALGTAGGMNGIIALRWLPVSRRNRKLKNANFKFSICSFQLNILLRRMSAPPGAGSAGPDGAGLESASGRCYAQDKLRTFVVAASKIVFHRQCLSPRN
jgi:hypothetical protein